LIERDPLFHNLRQWAPTSRLVRIFVSSSISLSSFSFSPSALNLSRHLRMSSVDFMNGPQAPPIPPASLAAYFTGLVSFLLADLRSALHSLPHYSSLRSNTKTPPEIYEILRQPTATWAELRKVLQVDRLLLGTLSQSSTLKDAMIGVSVFSVKGGDGWLGMACTSGGWQLVEILSYLGRLRDRVELAV